MIKDIDPRPLDWKAILEDLRKRGCSIYKTAKILGRPTSTAWAWFKGAEPSHSNGAALLQLHCAVCGEELTQERTKP